LDADEETLIAVRSPKGITPALTSLRKERLICAANENSDTRLPAITTGKRTIRSPRLGPMPLGPGFAIEHGWGLPDDDRQIQGAFRFAHFRAAKGFTPGAGNRAPAQRPSNQ
jgi:hypothetical protein